MMRPNSSRMVEPTMCSANRARRPRPWYERARPLKSRGVLMRALTPLSSRAEIDGDELVQGQRQEIYREALDSLRVRRHPAGVIEEHHRRIVHNQPLRPRVQL